MVPLRAGRGPAPLRAQPAGWRKEAHRARGGQGEAGALPRSRAAPPDLWGENKMVLSIRRGSRRAPPPRLWRPRPRARGLPRLTRPRPRPRAATPASPLRHRHPLPPRSGWQRGGAGAGRGGRGPRLDTARGRGPGSPGTAGCPRGRLTEQVAPALRTFRNARRGSAPRSRGSAGLARGGGGSRASVQGSAGAAAPPPARPPSPPPPPPPRPRPPRRAPQRPPSRARARARGPRAGRAWSHPGAGAAAVLSTSGARCGQRRGREPRAPLYSQRPIQDPDSGGGDSRHLPVPPRGAAPSPHCSPPARRCRASSSPAA
ncbi:translation initiation factor IF-2-like [Bubalus bubalis]|uniref:translation initiation factor IF-2-like n=1 Tax=Bubalus bubalis TaxID=89462 RepID=UPI001E1B80DF|nr:translation initiation factor IF-2-like [Bubalus bubalis]